MWIWYVDRTEGGDPGRIAARAKRDGIGTLYIKSGDGGSYWSQFNNRSSKACTPPGSSVCAWAFVYGDTPVAEARVGGHRGQAGADCLVIDAEGQYEGKYAAAERYMRALRARIGAEFPVALAAFPYVDYHPAFPYSVFFAPDGAQYNQPQMYWKAIGTSVRGIYEHTYLYNRVWGKPLYPLGQTYMAPARSEIVRFRRFAENYGGEEVSWWAWHETNSAGLGRARRQTRRPGPRLPADRHQPGPQARQQRRPRRLGADAPARRRPPRPPDHRHLREADDIGRPHLPGRKGPSGQRRDRPDDLEANSSRSNRSGRSGRGARRSGGGARRPAAQWLPTARSRPRCRPRPTRSILAPPSPEPALR